MSDTAPVTIVSPPVNINSLLHTVPKLGNTRSDGTITSYQDWKFALSMVLRRAGCWNIMSAEIPKKEDADYAAWAQKADEALTAIGLTVDPSQYQYISDATNGVDAWKTLSKLYEKNSRANRIALMRQFYGAKHDPAKPIRDYISTITSTASKLKAIGMKLEDETINDALIMNLHESWSSTAASLSMKDTLTAVADVTGALIDEEGRRAINSPADNADDPNLDTVWVARSKKYNAAIRCFRCDKVGHTARNCRASAPKDDTANVAYECHDPNDYAF